MRDVLQPVVFGRWCCDVTYSIPFEISFKNTVLETLEIRRKKIDFLNLLLWSFQKLPGEIYPGIRFERIDCLRCCGV